MTGSDRLLTIMGSGETSPTMVKTHRQILDRLGAMPGPNVLLDTPFGFQANADDVAARAVAYFRESVGAEVEVVSFRSPAETHALAGETALARLRGARWVFAGPGSPTYALRQWAGTPVPEILAGKLARGGAVTFASAAAITLGVAAVPVYEIYKVGADPHWADGLDLLSAVGLPVAVIPHYDNAEGGTHDTRYCYLGEPRLARMESELPEGAFVLGVDEHTGLVLDLEAGTAEVVGLGGVTVRAAGRSVEIPADSTVPIEDLRRAAAGARSAGTASIVAPVPPQPSANTPFPFLVEVDRLESAFHSALDGADVEAAVAALLELDRLVVDWSRDTLQSDHADRARSVLRSLVVRLGELAAVGARDPREVLGPLVEALLAVRDDARSRRDWAAADAIRDHLEAAGVQVRDAQEASEWGLLS